MRSVIGRQWEDYTEHYLAVEDTLSSLPYLNCHSFRQVLLRHNAMAQISLAAELQNEVHKVLVLKGLNKTSNARMLGNKVECNQLLQLHCDA